MSARIKAILIVLAVSLVFLHSKTPVSAVCQVSSCTPIFASDPGLTNRVTQLQQKSLSSFSPKDLYVGYEVTDCDNTPKIGYCSDSWHGLPPTNYCNGNKVDASGDGFKNINGKRYFVSKVPGTDYNDHFAGYPRAGIPKLNGIRTNFYDGSWLCATDATIPASYLTESCTITPAATRQVTGSYSVTMTIMGTQLIPEKGYKAIFAPANSLEANPSTRAVVFTVQDGAQDTIQQGFSGIQVDAGVYQVCVVPNESNDVTACASAKCSNTVKLDATTPTGNPQFSDPDPNTNAGGRVVPFVLCDQAADAKTQGPDYQACIACQGKGALWTAFGCVQTSKEGIVTSLVRVGIGISGGFVLLSILYGAFLLTTSSGDPKRVQEGQEMVTAAIMGLMFVIFSIIILRFIGVSILQIPGFGTT